MKVGRTTVSDRASAGIYEDRSGPEIERLLREALGVDVECIATIVPDEAALISAKLCEFTDVAACNLVITTGGTETSVRDMTPEATQAVLERELPGFGEAMRMLSITRVPAALLSRATASTRGRSLIVNLPGKPSAVRECLEILLPAIREGLAHLDGEYPH